MITLILDLIALASILVFTIYIVKLWLLLRHKALFVFILTGVVGIVLRLFLLAVSTGITTQSEINLYRTILGNAIWVFLALGAVILYLEIKKVFK